MAYQATHWAWDLDLPTTQKFTLIALADMADENFTCYPGQERISKMIGASVETVRRALRGLEDAGLLAREQRRRGDGYRTSDRYQLRVGTSPRKLTGENLTGQSEDSHRSNGPNLTGQSEGVITSKNHQSESPDTPATAVAVVTADPFEEFWAEYPIRKGKKEARAAFTKALRRAELDTILAGVRAYTVSLGPNPDPSKVKWAQGWLNGDRWNDEHASPSIPAVIANSKQATTLQLMQHYAAVEGGQLDEEGDHRALARGPGR